MTEKPSRLGSRIDFGQDGKQCDYLQLPHSVHRSAYGWLPVPLVCIKNGDGPTVLLTSGVHGDEYEGQVTLSRLIREIEVTDVKGRIITLPMANYPAAKAGLRTSPIDDLNLNRVFPGDADGCPTLMLAHYMESVLMPLADYALDLHSGGSSLMYLPTVILRAAVMSDTVQKEVVELGRVFGAPYGFFFPPGQGGGATNMATAARHGIVPIGTEMGGSGAVTPECLRYCESGVRRVLRHIGVWNGAVGSDEEPAAETRMLSADTWESFSYASEDGLFEPVVELGDEVVKGQLAARIHSPETPWREPA
ncbi:MAG: succinylglutamate desuccinylase/aspartoacylase family protein, partial [Alphaproteobacteria bacterium]|nr:succinylglutamate desuccinylase/aspartoacylase family protein [Alphaproteobacteria bacterium]